MPPQQQQTAQGWWGVTLCSVLLVVLLIAGFISFAVWINVGPNAPRFTVASLSVSGGQVAINVSRTNPNRYFGIYYEDATRASLFFNDTRVASGEAFAAGVWYQPSMSTTSVAGVLDVVDRTFSAVLRAGRLPLRLHLTTAVSFSVIGAFQSNPLTMKFSCDLLVGANGSLLRDSVGAPCDRYVVPLIDDDD